MQYTIANAVFLLSGLIAGAMGGYTMRSLSDLQVAVTGRRTRLQTEPTTVVVESGRSTVRRRWLGALVLLLTIGSGVVVVLQTSEVRDLTFCLDRYATAFAGALAERQDPNTEAQERLRTAMRTVRDAASLPPAERQTAVTAAIDEWLRSSDAATRQQQLSPYPPPPDQLCGDR